MTPLFRLLLILMLIGAVVCVSLWLGQQFDVLRAFGLAHSIL